MANNRFFQADIDDRVTGTLVGLATGDALGAPLEFKSRERIRKDYPEPLTEMTASPLWKKGEFTDDTQMALILAESLLCNHRLDSGDVGARFQRWAETAKDVGMQTRRVLRRPAYTADPIESAHRDYLEYPHQSAGNGALMRCAPLALFRLESLPLLIECSRRSAAITHGDPKAHGSCVLLNAWIRQIILHQTRDARSEVFELLPERERTVWSRWRDIGRYPESQIRSGGYTVDTLEAATWSFLTTSSFEEAVVCAANLGDDSDTVAAITGALAGAFYGYSAIPQRWLDELVSLEYICETAISLQRVGRENS